MTRRQVLAGGTVATVGLLGGAAAAVETEALPGKRRLTQAIEGCGPDGVPPTGPAGQVVRATLRSRARGRTVETVVIRPPGHAVGSPLPVALVLHGRGGRAADAVDQLALDRYLAAAVRAGAPPFALAAVDGGGTYWHRRADGDDPEAMLLTELLPRLAATGLRTASVGVLGWSMGGYGALLLARRHPGLVTAVAASSPAAWHAYGDSAPGAFDSAADFAAHRVVGVGPAAGVPYRIDCGHADPFYDVSRTLVGQLRAAEHGYGKGCHTAGYWRRVAPAQLAFLGHHLAA